MKTDELDMLESDKDFQQCLLDRLQHELILAKIKYQTTGDGWPRPQLLKQQELIKETSQSIQRINRIIKEHKLKQSTDVSVYFLESARKLLPRETFEQIMNSIKGE